MKQEIAVNSEILNINILEHQKDSPNVIFIMTPIVTVNDALAESFYSSLSNDNNVFAIDFLGFGKSSGTGKNINYDFLKLALIKVIEYIQINYNKEIHFYGGTGTGGILAQALISDIDISKNIASFSQYGVSIFNDISIMGRNDLYKKLFPIIKMIARIFPDKKMKFTIPKYNGFNSKKEDEWYSDIMIKYPGCFDMKLPLISTLLSLFFSNSSPLNKTHKVPVLVLASKHDRYYYPDYINRYFKNISQKKKIVWYNDSHLCFSWNSTELCKEVNEWIKENRLTIASS